MENKYTAEDLKIMQGWSLEKKIQVTQTRIMEWYIRHEGKVYISFSGGKDSTVLLDLARRIYPDIEAVFVDTGLEYPEIRDFVKTKENVTWLKPKMTFVQVLEKYGYPVISKRVSNSISRFRINKNEKWRYDKFINGINPDGTKTQFVIPKKYQDVALNAPFKISDNCCGIMKHRPCLKYEAETHKKPIIAMMAGDDKKREQDYKKTGCNAFESKRQMSNPMGFWTEQDVLQYIKRCHIPYCSVYGDILTENNNGESTQQEPTEKLLMSGCKRTGCMFCMFGVHLEKSPNRFQRMAITHPKQYDYCINKLGCGEVLDFIGVDYKPVETDIM